MSPRTSLALLFTLALATGCMSPMDRDAPGGPGGRAGHGPRGGNADADIGASYSPMLQLQEQLRDTADALRLTPKQTALWDIYQEKVGALMADQMKIPPYQSSRLSAIEQIGRKADVVRNRLAAMEDIQEAAAKLYLTFDESQKATADRMLAGTVPALYSGLGGTPSGGERTGGRNRMGGGAGGDGGGPGGGGPRGGGFGRF